MATLTETLGVDIAFANGEPRIGSHADYATTTGVDNLRQSILRRLATRPGEYRVNPSYGVGAADFVKKPLTSANIYELQHRIRENVERDPRISKVVEAKAEQVTYGGLPALKITVRIAVKGQSLALEPFIFVRD